MKETFIRKIRKSGTSSCVNFPKEIIQLLNLKEGDMVKVTVEKVEN